MAEFTVINTQEEFNERIKERLQREAEKYEKYTSPEDLEKINAEHKKEIDKLNETITTHKKDIADKDAKIKGYETDSAKTRIARETGLSYEAIDYIQGSDEEAMKKSAEALKALIGSGKSAPPLGDPEPAPSSDPTAAAWSSFSKELSTE